MGQVTSWKICPSLRKRSLKRKQSNTIPDSNPWTADNTHTHPRLHIVLYTRLMYQYSRFSLHSMKQGQLHYPRLLYMTHHRSQALIPSQGRLGRSYCLSRISNIFSLEIRKPLRSCCEYPQLRGFVIGSLLTWLEYPGRSCTTSFCMPGHSWT